MRALSYIKESHRHIQFAGDLLHVYITLRCQWRDITVPEVYGGTADENYEILDGLCEKLQRVCDKLCRYITKTVRF